MYSEHRLDHQILKNVLEKKLQSYLIEKRSCVKPLRPQHLRKKELWSVWDQSCELSYRAKAPLRWGFNKMFQRLKAQGHQWNHKRVYRVHCELALNLRKKPKERFQVAARKP